MIIGIGCDLVANARIEKLLSRYGEKFARKILAPNEFATWQTHAAPIPFLAKRFAAKEAFAKAIGTGFRNGLLLKHIAVTNNALGAPSLILTDKAQMLAEGRGVTQIHLSLSDEKDMSMAFVVLC